MSLCLQAILIFSFVRYKAVEYNDKPFPIWADVLGWGMTLASNVPIVIVALYVFIRAPGATLLQVSEVKVCSSHFILS